MSERLRAMLSDAIGDLLPSALGWIAGLLVVSVVVVLLVRTGSDADSDDPGLNRLKLGVGLVFLAMAAQQWTKRPGGGEDAAFVVLGSASVAGSMLFSFVAGDRAARPLAAVKQFMSDNNAVIMFVVLLLLGATLAGDGLAVWS